MIQWAVPASRQIQIIWEAVVYVATLLWNNARITGILFLLQAACSGAASPLIVWSLGNLIDVLAQTRDNTWLAVLPWLVGIAMGFILRSTDKIAGTYIATVLRHRLHTGIQRQVYEQAIALPLAVFERPEYYHKLENSQRILDGTLVFMLRAIGTLISAAVGGAGVMLLFAQAHWLLPVLILATTIVRSVLSTRANLRFLQVNYGRSPLRREMSYWATLLSSREAAPELRVFGLGVSLLGRWRGAFDRYLADVASARLQVSLYRLLNAALQELTGLTALLILILLALQGVMSLGMLVALLYALVSVRLMVQSISYGISELTGYGADLARLREFLTLEAESKPQHGSARQLRPLRQGVRFHNVSFSYPGADRPALAGINFTLSPGESLALVGENGAGKTTLAKLLLGLYRPTHGSISVDGVDLADIDPRQWRREVTAVFQDFGRYPTTVYENIAYADVSLLRDGTTNDSFVPPQVLAASAKSDADAFIRRLPVGYATQLGKEFEAGVELSAGQWQRLALARAYLRNAQIVVLDEPTAALDARAELAVYQQFQRAATGRSAVLISHRLGVARLADRIIVLRAGGIAEEGDHDTLLGWDGEYARMYRLQASWYDDEAEVVA